MKKILILVVLGIAVWQAREHWNDLFEPAPSHQAVIRNKSRHVIERVRLTIDGRTFVRERIDPEAEAMIPFKVAHDASFSMLWQWGDMQGEPRWSGGFVTPGPLVQRHVIVIHDDASVVYLPEALPARPSR
jgi:hypothetical protein